MSGMKYGGSVKKEGVAVSVILGLLLAGVLSFAVFGFDDFRARKTRTAPLPESSRRGLHSGKRHLRQTADSHKKRIAK